LSKTKITPNHTTISIMNLWAKSLGRLVVLAAVLFFFSCQDESSLLGIRNSQPKFNVSYIEIPLESSVVSIDSVYTDNKSSLGGVLVGQYQDNLMGNIRSEAYLQIIPSGATRLSTNYSYDSLMVQFRFNFYSYGFSGVQTEKFTIHEITGDSLSLYSPTVRYKASSTIAYNPTPMAEVSVTVDYDSLKKQYGLAAASQDTLTVQARLSDEIGKRIFDYAGQYDFSAKDHFVQFISNVKGLVLVPSQSSGILGIRLADVLSRVTMHYHSADDTLARSFGFSSPSFSNITIDRSPTELSSLFLPYQEVQPGSGMRYLQSGTPLVTKLDLSNFYELADTDSLDYVIINEAELIISDVESSSGFEPHSSLALKPMREDNHFFNTGNASDSIAMRQYHNPPQYNYIFPSGNHYFVGADLPTQVVPQAQFVYNSRDNEYRQFITLFVQSLFLNKEKAGEINPSRLKYLALYPIGPSTAHAVNRTRFPADKVKLRLYYTRPSINTTP
jgi:hypothetical protein